MKLDGFIEAEEVAGHSVKHACELFEVSRAAYYQRQKHIASPREVADGELLETIREIHDDSDSTYGSPRVHHELLARAMVSVRLRVAPHNWEAFQLTALGGETPQEVARRLAMNVTHVYAARWSVQRLLREEVSRLESGQI